MTTMPMRLTPPIPTDDLSWHRAACSAPATEATMRFRVVLITIDTHAPVSLPVLR